MLTNYYCGSSRPLVFIWLIEPEWNTVKRRRVQKQGIAFDDKLFFMTSNMMNKRRKSIIGKHSSNTDQEEVLHHIRLKIGILAPRNYKRLAERSNENYKYIAITQL